MAAERGRSTVYVDAVHPTATEEAVTELFATFGKVTHVDLPVRDGTRLGYAFVSFEDVASAKAASRHYVWKKHPKSLIDSTRDSTVEDIAKAVVALNEGLARRAQESPAEPQDERPEWARNVRVLPKRLWKRKMAQYRLLKARLRQLSIPSDLREEEALAQHSMLKLVGVRWKDVALGSVKHLGQRERIIKRECKKQLGDAVGKEIKV
eukprot:Sspe_Gene.99165::Locus_72579_Transcript_1_1_Confidence_1.000_Length_680::g.99165::m.99165